MVVELGVVVLDALQEQIARLLQEGVDREIQGVEVGVERGLRGVGVLLERRQVRGERELFLRRVGGQLVEERCEEVRVVDDQGQLDQDVLVAETALLQTAGC